MKPQARFIPFCLGILLVAAVAVPAYGDQITAGTGYVTPSPVSIEPLDQPPVVTPEMQAQREATLEALHRIRQKIYRLPINPNAPELTSPQSPESHAVLGGGNENRMFGPGTFSVFRSTALTDAFTNNQTSSTNEPSLGMSCGNVFYTGNWYATLSTDYGQTFSYVNPYTFFPGFCCDQVAYYEESRDLTFWYLQASFGFSGNSVRLGVTDDPANAPGSFWTYTLTPQDLGYSSDVNFDYPDLSVSNNSLYIMTNAFSITTSDTSFEAGIVMRFPLDQLAAAGGVSFQWFDTNYGTLRPTHGATTTMYFGTHADNSTMRIYSWAEGSNTINFHNEGIATFYSDPSAPSPDGTDWLDFGDTRALAGWVAGGIVGFMWNSASGGPYSQANVRWARFNEAGLGLASEGAVWNDNYAWAYPSVHPNDSGELGGTISAGGGGSTIPYPALHAWIADSYNAGMLSPLENQLVANSTDGPSRDRWGDYYTTRRNSPFGETWVGTGFVLNGGQSNSDAEPYFIWFGREEDTPAVGPEISCAPDDTVECAGSCGVSRDDPQLAAFFAGVSASVECGDVVITDDAPSCFPLGTTTVTFTATDDGGETAMCMADVTVEDTTPPVIACPIDTTVECSSYCGVPETDPQLVPFFAGVSATDVCDNSPVITDDRPTCFPLGTTTVEFIATDASGNADTCTADVTVEDTTPPDITVSVSPDALWPPNHKLVCITATVVVTDICDPDPDLFLESITSSEPDNGKGDGNTVGDIAEADTGTADIEFKLRSERSGKSEDGRTYTIIYRATDMSGNSAWDTAYVDVPHDMSAGMMAAAGFNATGTDIALGASELTLVLLSHEAEYDARGGRELLVRPALYAPRIDVSRAYIGNTAGVATPQDSWVIDANHDGLKDLVLVYPVRPVEEIQLATASITAEMIKDGAIWDGPVGLHVWGPNRTGFLVDDIFASGEPVALVRHEDQPNIGKDGPGVGASSDAETPVAYDNAIASIYPNPFNPRTTIRYTIAAAADVRLAIYDVKGSLVRVLVDANVPGGEHTAVWDGTDESGGSVATGVYFARMVMPGFEATRKMVLIK